MTVLTRSQTRAQKTTVVSVAKSAPKPTRKPKPAVRKPFYSSYQIQLMNDLIEIYQTEDNFYIQFMEMIPIETLTREILPFSPDSKKISNVQELANAYAAAPYVKKN